MLSKDWFKKLPTVSYMHDMVPLSYLMSDDKTIITKKGDFIQTLEVYGRDYQNRDEDEVESLFISRKRWVESAPENIAIGAYSHRYEVNRTVENEAYINPLAHEINSKWNESFTTTYRTRHFLVYSTEKPRIIDTILYNPEADHDADTDEEKYRKLNQAVGSAMSTLEAYNPRILIGDELLSYWSWQINGRHLKQSVPNNRIIDELISDVAIEWPSGKKYQIYDDINERYSAWLSLKFFTDDKTSVEVVDKLFKVKREFIVYQHFGVMEKGKARSYIEKQLRHVNSFFSNSGNVQMELEGAMQRLEADELSFLQYSISIQVFANTLKELERSVEEIKAIPENHGLRMVREGTNQEALYWSIYPGLHGLNTRKRVVSSENASDLISFASIGHGMTSCSWGDMPVTRFRTTSATEYSFTFHRSTEKQALGHTLIVGDSGSGKTTLIEFLITQSLKYKGFKALLFDRLNGMHNMTRILDGHFEDFVNVTQLNPFHLKDTYQNRAFLASFLKMLTRKDDDESMRIINRAVDLAYTLPKNERTLDSIKSAFGTVEKDSIASALEKWQSGGAFGHYFTGNRDSLSFDESIITFDMTTLIDMPDVLGPMTDYIMHSLKQYALEHSTPYIVGIDELPRYLENPLFAAKIEELALEIRKSEGVLLLAMQEPTKLIENKYGNSIIGSMANYIIFPNSTAKREVYIDGLALTEGEYEWVKSTTRREVLFKRLSGESIVLDVDLSALGNLLNIFSSSTTKVKQLREEIKKGGDWKERYINA